MVSGMAPQQHQSAPAMHVCHAGKIMPLIQPLLTVSACLLMPRCRQQQAATHHLCFAAARLSNHAPHLKIATMLFCRTRRRS